MPALILTIPLQRLHREGTRRLPFPGGWAGSPSDGRGQPLTPNGRRLTAPDGRSARCPLPAMRTRLWPGGIRRAPRCVRSPARRRLAARQRPTPTVKRVGGLAELCRKNECSPIRNGASGRWRSIPGSGDPRPTWLIAPKIWMPQSPRALHPGCCCPPTARPGYRRMPANGDCDATEHPSAPDRPPPARLQVGRDWLHPGDTQQRGEEKGGAAVA